MGPKDRIQVTVWGEGNLTTEDYISPTGTVRLPLIGEVQADGKTALELRDEIQRLYARDYLRNPIVTVTVIEWNSKIVRVIGEVAHPGNHPLTEEGVTLEELIVQVGGLLPTRSVRAIIIPAQEETKAPDDVLEGLDNEDISDTDLEKLLQLRGARTVDLRPLDLGLPLERVLLKPGDTVIIPSRDRDFVQAGTIWIQGEVNSPGAYPYQEGLGILTACIQAGGFTDLASNKARVLRREKGSMQIYKVNLKKIRKGKEPDFPLRPGDHITVKQRFF